VKIENTEIGLEFPPFVIAEVGVNYDNSMEYAEELIKAAKRAGANAVKFQTYKPSKIVAIDSPKYWEDEKPTETQFEFFKRSNTFYHEETKELARLCKSNKILFMSTPFDLDSVDLLETLGVPAYKIASADITNFPLLRKVAKTKKPVLLSTGASSIGEIEMATRLIEEEGNSHIVLLHCILAYPTPVEHSNLRMIKNLRDIFPQYEVGWSDHVIPENNVTTFILLMKVN
jgi:N-acetylneuraminate synthase